MRAAWFGDHLFSFPHDYQHNFGRYYETNLRCFLPSYILCSWADESFTWCTYRLLQLARENKSCSLLGTRQHDWTIVIPYFSTFNPTQQVGPYLNTAQSPTSRRTSRRTVFINTKHALRKQWRTSYSNLAPFSKTLYPRSTNRRRRKKHLFIQLT